MIVRRKEEEAAMDEEKGRGKKKQRWWRKRREEEEGRPLQLNQTRVLHGHNLLTNMDLVGHYNVNTWFQIANMRFHMAHNTTIVMAILLSNLNRHHCMTLYYSWIVVSNHTHPTIPTQQLLPKLDLMNKMPRLSSLIQQWF